MSAAPSYQDLLGRLLDVEDPPLPDVTHPLRDMAPEEKREHTMTMVQFLAGFGAISAICFYYDLRFWGWVFGVFATPSPHRARVAQGAHRARVRVDFDSRINQALQTFAFAIGMGLAVLVLIISLVTVGTLVGFLVGGALGVVTFGVIAVVAQLGSMLLGKLTGATFDGTARAALGRELRHLPTTPRKP